MNQQPNIIYSAAPDSLWTYVKKAWKFRNLIYTFTYQEIKTQYAQTRLNLLWLALRPLMVVAIFAFIFDHLFHVPGLHSPYPLFAFSGLIIWNNFSFMVNNAGSVIYSNHNLIRKIYFPRLILVLSKTLSGLVELSVALILIFFLLLIYHQPIHLNLLLLPFFIITNLIIGTGVAVWLNALSIKHRDINQLIPSLVNFLIWLTPVFYPATMIPDKFSFLIYLNPLAGVIQGCRWAILGDDFPSIYFLPIFLFCMIFTLTGVWYFARQEDTLVDNI